MKYKIRRLTEGDRYGPRHALTYIGQRDAIEITYYHDNIECVERYYIMDDTEYITLKNGETIGII